jgi:pyruvate kinase
MNNLVDRYAKIVATIGPSCDSEDILISLIEAGLDVARLNFSHGTYTDHAARISRLRLLSKKLGKPITILQDLQGPKMRVGVIPNKILLSIGEIVTLSPSESKDLPEDEKHVKIPFEFPELEKVVGKGNRVLLDDGNLELEVTNIRDQEIEAKVLLGGYLSSHKGVNVPGAHLTIPGFTEKDKADLAFGLEQNIDALAISFVCSAQDIVIVREAIQRIAPHKTDTPIIAKLERPEALENLESILHIADGVMVARGDLGVEMSPEFVPIAQKKIIREANRAGKIVITATQMLDSMINNPRPTRAEASDVANAVFDGTDAVMLSGETASGKYPLESVKMMDSIVREAENHFVEWGKNPRMQVEDNEDDAVAITRAARELACDRNVNAIAVFTQTGHTALLMAKARPGVPILAFTPEEKTYFRMGLYWGVTPYRIPYTSTMEELLAIIESAIISSTSIKPGQQIILVSGFPIGIHRVPNFAFLHTIGSRD